MARVTYSTKDDLLKGDIPLAPQYGDGTKLVENAADDIDAQLGHIYVTPMSIIDSSANRPSILLLKKINNLLASGRLVMDMALGGEDSNLNAYGRSLYAEGLKLLTSLVTEKIQLTGAEYLPTQDTGDDTGPSVRNEDAYSLVENFYQQGNPVYWRLSTPAALPYSGNAN